MGTEEEDVQPRMRAVVAKDVFTGVLSDSFRPRKHKDNKSIIEFNIQVINGINISLTRIVKLNDGS